jgi:hypothetical protein
MATINLGSIKFNWQGAYVGGTAYAVDDVVSYNGSSYICILASTGNLPTNGTYFEQMSGKGTDADLLNIASTVQGDLYYNNGSAIARLGAGTSGQALITGGTGANPSWGSAGGVVQVKTFHFSSNLALSVNINSLTQVPTGTFSLNFTPTSASNKVMLFVEVAVSDITSSRNRTRIGLYRDSTEVAPNTDTRGSRTHAFGGAYGDEDREIRKHILMFLDTPNTTSQVNYNFKATTDGTGTLYINRSNGHSNDGGQPVMSSSITAFEIDSGVL